LKTAATCALLIGALFPVGAKTPAAPAKRPSAKAHTPAKKPLRPADERIQQATNRLLEQSDVYWHRGEYDNVRATYAIITDLNPAFLDAWQNYGWILWAGLDQDDAAMRVFQRGLEYHPDRWELYFEIANLERHRRRFLSAAEWTAKATNHDAPMYVWHMRAHCLEYAGEIEKSKAMWKTIIRKFPDDPPAPANLRRLEEGRIHTDPAIGVEPLDKDAPAEPAQEEEPVTGAPGSI
jgi:tetratricopeptide (TPR) repeat protein